MFRKSAKNSQGSGITLIASNCEVEGDVYFSGELRINGSVKGNIFARDDDSAMVILSEKGSVTGEIKSPRAEINGRVRGDIYSDVHVELHAKAAIEGNVYYNLIEMVIGSQVDGNLVHVSPKAESGKTKVAPISKTGTDHLNFKGTSSSTHEV